MASNGPAPAPKPELMMSAMLERDFPYIQKRRARTYTFFSLPAASRVLAGSGCTWICSPAKMPVLDGALSGATTPISVFSGGCSVNLVVGGWSGDSVPPVKPFIYPASPNPCIVAFGFFAAFWSEGGCFLVAKMWMAVTSNLILLAQWRALWRRS